MTKDSPMSDTPSSPSLAGPPREEQLRALVEKLRYRVSGKGPNYVPDAVPIRADLQSLAESDDVTFGDLRQLVSLLAAAPSSAEGKEELPKLNGSQIRKGTGDVLKDLAHAQRFTESIQDQWGGPLGLEIDFIDRALRVAMAEIKNLRNRNAK